jgi:RNA polymerase sigma factor (sigma-70 family)
MPTANLNGLLSRLARGMDAELLGQESDRQLVERVLGQRDGAALQAIVHRHGAMVYRVCWRVLRHTQDTEDAFQATFLVLAQKLRTVRKHASLASWLHGVAHRISVKARGQAAARCRRESRASSPETRPPDDATSKELLSVLDAELSRLPDKWRLPLVLCYLEGRTQEEAAQRLAWSKSTLRSRLEEARDTLARRLSERGITLTTALAAVLLSDCVASAAPAPELLDRAVEAVTHVAAGQAPATATSAPVAALADGAVKAMYITKLKTIAVVLAAAVLVGSGIGTVSLPALQAKPTEQHDPVAEPKPSHRPAAKDDPVAKLVEQLGGPEFADREAAQKALRELGVKANPALRAGLKSENPEVRNRSAKILSEVRKDALEALVKGFDPAKEQQPDHPVWARFVAIAGDSQASRELFARIVANKKWIQTLDKAEADPANAGHIYRVGIADVFRDFHQDPAKSPPWPCDRPEEVAYLLLLGSHPDDNPPAKLTGDEIVPTNLRNTDFLGRGIIHGEGQITHANGLDLGLRGKIRFFNAPEVVGAAGTDRVFARLFAAWLVRRDPSSEVVLPAFRIAFGQRVPEVLPLARRYAANDFEPKREVPRNATIAALVVVAQLGTRADLPLFERHYGDETNVAAVDKLRAERAGDYHPAPVTDTTQMRDVALGLALLLHGENLEDFGFVVRKDTFIKQKDGRYTIPGSTQLHLGFDSEASRTTAHAKAKVFFDKQPKAEPKKEEPRPDPVAVKLVEQLGAAEFADREDAEKKLKELGVKANPALRAGLKSESPEVVRRCRAVLDHLRREEFKAAFLKAAGDDKPARALLAEVLNDAHRVKVLDEAVQYPERSGKLYAAEQWRLWQKAVSTPPGAVEADIPTAPEIALSFLLGSHPSSADALKTEPPPNDPRISEGRRAVETDLLCKSLQLELMDAKRRGPFARLMAAWMATRSDP